MYDLVFSLVICGALFRGQRRTHGKTFRNFQSDFGSEQIGMRGGGDGKKILGDLTVWKKVQGGCGDQLRLRQSVQTLSTLN